MTDEPVGPIKPKIMLGMTELLAPQPAALRMAAIIWGVSGVGKTTLASTASGIKLWVLFDPDGLSSLMSRIALRDDILLADFTSMEPNAVDRFRSQDPLKLGQTLKDNPQIETIVIDSVSTFNEIALKWAVMNTNGANEEAPTLPGYGKRNVYTANMVYNILRITTLYNRNVILICHEDSPQKDELTGRTFVSIMIGGGLQAQLPIKFSEVWRLSDTGKSRIIEVRQNPTYRPMKTRMFDPGDKSSFEWKYDATTLKGEGIAEWLQKWKANDGRKIPLPK